MNRICMIACVVLTASSALGQNRPARPVHDYTPSRPYVYERANWDAMLDEAGGDLEKKRAVLSMRWLEVTFAVGQINASTPPGFPHTLEYLSTGKLRSKAPLVRVDGDLSEDTEYPVPAMVMIWGDVSSMLTIPKDADLIHIWGELTGILRVSGDCEIIIAGDVGPQGIIETEGPASIFVGGDMNGMMRNKDSTFIWLNGNFNGELTTGAPMTRLHIMGNYAGSISPEAEADTLRLDVRGTMHSDYMRGVAAHVYKSLYASVGISELAAAFHPRTFNPQIGKWVVHKQDPNLPKPATAAPAPNEGEAGDQPATGGDPAEADDEG